MSATAWQDIIDKNALEKGMSLGKRAIQEMTEGIAIYPPKEQIFRALDLTPPESVKVVILGQDPYHTRGQANGLAFSISKGHRLQPSLQNIFKELQNDVGAPAPSCGDLTPWAEQGVLLLNASLTVYEGRANSHLSWGWHEFTTAVCGAVLKMPQPTVFLLWGSNAQSITRELSFAKYPNKTYYMTRHPSPMAQGSGTKQIPDFIGSRPFSKANAALRALGSEPVNWVLP